MEQDREFLFQLANDPSIRSSFFHTEKILWREHCEWFARRLQQGLFYIGIVHGDPCGYVRFEKNDLDQKEDELLVSIAIVPSYRNCKLGASLLYKGTHLALQKSGVRHIIAYVKQENVCSLRIFEETHYACCEKSVKFRSIALKFCYPAYEE